MKKSATEAVDVEAVRKAAARALGPIAPGRPASRHPHVRTDSGRDLPPQYLVYFLLVQLLGFRDLGRHEKVAWTVPIEYKGKFFAIEHRKMGLGIFAERAGVDEAEAAEICAAVHRAVRAAAPYFEHLAAEAVKTSTLNVRNRSTRLFERYTYFRDRFRKMDAQAEKRRDEKKVKTRKTAHGEHISIRMPYYDLKEKAGWVGQSAIDAFFSWTEHVFIHLALLQGNIKSGAEVADLAGKEWGEKFKQALDLDDPVTKRLYDELSEIRRQIRNYLAHGAFGKQGEAFQFHSDAGAVPLLLPHLVGKRKYSIQGALSFREDHAIAVLEEFIAHLWDGPREPARIHIQIEALPTILTNVTNGIYSSVMSSVEAMRDYSQMMNYRMDEASNMDW